MKTWQLAHEDTATSYNDLKVVGEAENSDVDDGDDDEESSQDEEYCDTRSVDDKYERFAFLQKDVLCFIQDKLEIPKSWKLLDR